MVVALGCLVVGFAEATDFGCESTPSLLSLLFETNAEPTPPLSRLPRRHRPHRGRSSRSRSRRSSLPHYETQGNPSTSGFPCTSNSHPLALDGDALTLLTPLSSSTEPDYGSQSCHKLPPSFLLPLDDVSLLVSPNPRSSGLISLSSSDSTSPSSSKPSREPQLS